MTENTSNKDLLLLLEKLLGPAIESYAKDQVIIQNITSPLAPRDYEETKYKAAQREFVKNLADKGTERINTELIPQLNIKFSEYDKSLATSKDKLGKIDELSEKFDEVNDKLDKIDEISDNLDKVDELSDKLANLGAFVEELESSIQFGGSNEWF